MTKLEKERWKEIGHYLIKDGWNNLLGIAAICSIVGVFLKAPNNQILWAMVVFIVWLLVTFFRVVQKLLRNEIKDEDLDIPTEIQKMVKYLYKKKKYNDVVRLGSTISRFLWLNHYYNQRIDIGKMVEDSASKTKNIKEQISALIDDIGWTFFKINNSKKAEANINIGINKAKKHQLYYYAAKGERHLAGIAAKKNRSNIIQHLTNAEDFTQKITDNRLKYEMEGSLSFAKAEYYFEEKNFLEAEIKILETRRIYENDADRIVKTHSLLGNIYLEQNTDDSIQKAKDEFNAGYGNCKDVRSDEYARNAIGLAKIEMKEGNYIDAKSYLEEAQTILKGTDEINDVNQLLNIIKNNGIQ